MLYIYIYLFCCVFEGYYCTLGASVGNPVDGTTGDICPRGYYCPLGSVAPLACSIGYYLDAEGSSTNDTCVICTEGI